MNFRSRVVTLPKVPAWGGAGGDELGGPPQHVNGPFDGHRALLGCERTLVASAGLLQPPTVFVPGTAQEGAVHARNGRLGDARRG